MRGDIEYQSTFSSCIRFEVGAAIDFFTKRLPADAVANAPDPLKSDDFTKTSLDTYVRFVHTYAYENDIKYR